MTVVFVLLSVLIAVIIGVLLKDFLRHHYTMKFYSLCNDVIDGKITFEEAETYLKKHSFFISSRAKEMFYTITKTVAEIQSNITNKGD